MFEVSFKVQHDCPYVHFSQRHPAVKIVEWCNLRTDVVEVECPDIETFARISPDLDSLLTWKGAKVLKKNFFEKNLQVIVKTCRDSRISPSVSGVIERNFCLEMDPIIYYGGWEERRVIGFRESDYKQLFRALGNLGPVVILEKRVSEEKTIRDTFAISLSRVFSELTEKQLDALLAALEYGYYEVPKKITAREIARKCRVPRTTYEEHVRKAEGKIFRAIAPYVRLYGSRPQRLLAPYPQLSTK